MGDVSSDVIAFVHARLDEEKAQAEKLPDLEDYSLDPWEICWEETGEWNSYAYLRIAKKRVLAEVEAKKGLLDEHTDVNDGSCGTCVDGHWGYPTHGGSSPQNYPCRTLRLLALPYREHPEFRPEWASGLG
jgi:hypothetical protein